MLLKNYVSSFAKIVNRLKTCNYRALKNAISVYFVVKKTNN